MREIYAADFETNTSIEGCKSNPVWAWGLQHIYKTDKTYNYDGDASQETTGTQCIVDQTLPVTFTIPDGISYIRFHIGILSGNLSDLTIDKLSLVKNSN